MQILEGLELFSAPVLPLPVQLILVIHQDGVICHLPADTKQYPAFVGHKPGRNNTQRHKLDIQLIMIMNRTLYIAAR